MKHLLSHLPMLVLGLTMVSCASYYQGPVSDHFDGKRFYNPDKPMKKGFFAFLKWRFTADRGPWPEYRPLDAYDTPPERVTGDTIRLSYVGHATVLIQTHGLNILTDPVWSERASPVTWAGPKRVHPPGIKLDDLPSIDLVLLSHNHYDHMDLKTLQYLWEMHRPRIITPLGNDTILHNHNSSIKVENYDWGDEVRVNDQISVHLDPMHHWSARGLFDRNKALWAAFTIATPTGNIYFAGDTGYGGGDYFRMAKEKHGSFHLAILPIGDYDPRWFMEYGHMNPEEVIKAKEDLGNPYVLPIHYDVFPLADTGYGEPVEELRRVLEGRKRILKKIILLTPGETSSLGFGKE